MFLIKTPINSLSLLQKLYKFPFCSVGMEYKDWLLQAERDLETAKNSLLSKDYYASAFWSQQSIEKCLKAVIIKELKILVKSHDIIFLGRKAKLPKELIGKLKLFSGVYTESRYGITNEEIPSSKFKEKDSSEILNIAKEVLGWSRKMI